MIVKFTGLIEERKRGCSACGKSEGSKRFVRSKLFYLPSGISKVFRAGIPEEVKEIDGSFLLSYDCFEEV